MTLTVPDFSTARVVVAGDVDAASAIELVARHFGDVPYQPLHARPQPTLQPEDLHVELPLARAQAQIGYAVPAQFRAVFEHLRLHPSVLVVDVSGSMQAEDVSPDRMTAAKKAASSFPSPKARRR